MTTDQTKHFQFEHTKHFHIEFIDYLLKKKLVIEKSILKARYNIEWMILIGPNVIRSNDAPQSPDVEIIAKGIEKEKEKLVLLQKKIDDAYDEYHSFLDTFYRD